MKKNIVSLLIFIFLLFFVFVIFTSSTNKNNDYVLVNVDNHNKKHEKDRADLIGKIFTRTYNVNNIAFSYDNRYMYITIREFQKEEIETVKVEKEWFNSVKVGDNYEMIFKIKNNMIKDNIKSIFMNSEILNVKKTDKVGLEQINEKIG